MINQGDLYIDKDSMFIVVEEKEIKQHNTRELIYRVTWVALGRYYGSFPEQLGKTWIEEQCQKLYPENK